MQTRKLTKKIADRSNKMIETICFQGKEDKYPSEFSLGQGDPTTGCTCTNACNLTWYLITWWVYPFSPWH